MNETGYIPRIGETYRWIAYEYAAFALFGVAWGSMCFFTNSAPKFLFACMPSFLILALTGGIVGMVFSIFGIKNASGVDRKAFVRTLIFSVFGPLIFLALIIMQIIFHENS